MTSTFSLGAPRQMASGWLTSSVLLIGLLAAVPGAHADTIPDWNLITAKALQTAKAGTGLAHSRVYAMVHGAMFDAVNAIDRRYHSYAADLEAAAGASPDAAAAVAAHTVLVDLYPLQKATLRRRAGGIVGQDPGRSGQGRWRGARQGGGREDARAAPQRQDEREGLLSHRKAARAYSSCPRTRVRSARTGDRLRRSRSRTYRTSASRARHRWRASATLEEFNEVKAVGAKNSTQRTAEQTAIALLWQPTSPITYNAMLRAMPELKQKSIVEQARVFALLNMAASDALHCRAGATNTCSCSGVRRRRSATPTAMGTMQRPPTRPGRACSHRSLHTPNIPPVMRSLRA